MSANTIFDLMPRIDALDEGLVDLLVQRFVMSREIGRLKAGSGYAPFDPVRVQSQIGRFADRCAEAGLDRWMGQQVISVVIGQVIVERFTNLAPPAEHDREKT